MADTWTTPKTWATDDAIDQATLNTHVRDNLSYLFARLADVVQVEYQETSGTNAESISSGAWRTRDLNTLVVDTNSIASLASKQITLPEGRYLVIANSSTGNNADERLRIRDVTNSVTKCQGINMGAGNSNVSLVGTFTLAASAALELQHYPGITDAAGDSVSTGEVEVYCQVVFIRLEQGT